MTFYQGDAITVMKTLGDHTVNLIYTNPPFNGATKNKWDTVINWPDFFKEAFRLLTPNGTLSYTVQYHSTIPLYVMPHEVLTIHGIGRRKVLRTHILQRYSH